MKDNKNTRITAVLGLCLLGGSMLQAAEWAEPGNGLEKHTLQHDGHQRTYWVHLAPESGDGQKPPLVIALHGGGGLARQFDRSTLGTFTAATDQRGMMVVFPQGVDRRWNCGREEIFRHEKKYDDVGFIAALIETMHLQHNIDTQRVYATGISNGGFMSYRLALELSDQIAAVAPVTAQIPKAMADRRPEHPISLLVINGTADPLVPYTGGHVRLVKWGRSRGEIISTDDTIQHFRTVNQCNNTPVVETLPDLDSQDGTRVTRESYTGGAEGAEVVLLRVEGGGHTWPQGLQYIGPRVVGVVSRDINASEIIVDFFSRHTLTPETTAANKLAHR